MMRNRRAPTEPIASMIIGTVITGGDSCGCCVRPPSARFPKKVMSTMRVM